jgi:signal peptidase I
VRDLPAFKGDRILVNKFPYEFGGPERFDVVVFKYPEDPTVNYIKRLVGLPGETIRVTRGDLYARIGDVDKWKILRKDNPDKQKALQIPVYDNDHPETALHDLGWPERWAAMAMSDDPAVDGSGSVAGWIADTAGWQPVAGKRAFELSAPADAAARLHWLRYRHIVPGDSDWAAAEAGHAPIDQPRPQLVTDFCGYNTYTAQGHSAEDLGVYWVGDLTLSFRAEVRSAGESGELILELTEGARRYRCRLEPATGAATLYFLDGLDPSEERPVARASSTPMKGAGTYDVRFANVDDRLCLWIDDKLVEFDAATEYAPPAYLGPGDTDLVPVGIAAKNVDLVVSRLLLERDTYYRADAIVDRAGRTAPMEQKEYDGTPRLAQLLHNPRAWYDEYQNAAKEAEFNKLGDDEFFVLGDNSPRSKDSRLWSNARRARNRHAVPRTALVGKAFYVYWPHGIPFMNGGRGYALPLWNHRLREGDRVGGDDAYAQFRVPFYPNIWRMERIR